MEREKPAVKTQPCSVCALKLKGSFALTVDLDLLAYLKCRHLTLRVKLMFSVQHRKPRIGNLLLGRCLDASSGLACGMKVKPHYGSQVLRQKFTSLSHRAT